MTRKQAQAEPRGVARALELRQQRSALRQLSVAPADAVDFSSNDFLSLAPNHELRQEFLNELRTILSETQLGSGGSRLLDGNSTYAEALEQEIAAFHNAPAGLLCNSGFDGNVSIFSCLPQPGDIIVYDELIHASVHDGMRLSRADQCVPCAHNDVRALEDVLLTLIANNGGVRDGSKNVWVGVEATYSMDGDVAPLREVVELLARMLPNGNGHLIVDEAHATGVFGELGRGLVHDLGLEDHVAIRLVTFGKALACGGAIVLCSPLLREYLINYARPLIYSTFMTYPSLAAIKASYNLLQAGTIEPLRHRLQGLISFFRECMLELEDSLQLSSKNRHLLRIPCASSRSAISYIMSSQPRLLAAHCRERNFIVRAIVPPTVPAGTERIRICIHSGNTRAQLSGLMAAISSWVKQQVDASKLDHSQAKL